MNKLNPLVSIVLTTYNGSQFLDEQISSLTNQTYKNIEIIIVDDCSSDSSVEIIKKHQSTNQSIRLFENQANLGYVKNFEKGMLLATGDFISLCDQDDIWLPDKTAVLMQHLAGNEIVYCDSYLINENGDDLGVKVSGKHKCIDYDNPIMFAVGNWMLGHAMLFKRELVTRCTPFPTTVAHDFWLGYVASFSGTIHFVNQPLVKYRMHQSNASVGKMVTKRTSAEKDALARQRIQLLYNSVPQKMHQSKDFYGQLSKSYQSYSLHNNTIRMLQFLKFRHLILAYKRKNSIMKILYSIKVFFKIP